MTSRDPRAVAIVLVGDELLRGQVRDVNGPYVAQRVAAEGLRLVRSTTVPDDVAATVAALREAAGCAPFVVVSGGLGSTSDDRTREALATFARVVLVRDMVLEQRLRDSYAARGQRPPHAALAMADVPEGAHTLPNPVGAAPGLHLVVHDGGRTDVFAAAGVPHEFAAVVKGSVLPAIRRLAGPGSRPAAATLRVASLGEPTLAGLLADLEADLVAAGGGVGYLPSAGEVQVRLSAPDEAILRRYVGQARTLLGSHAYDSDLALVVHRALLARGETLAAAESLTGGLLAARLTDVPGVSATFRGGVVTYATELKERLLGVPHALLDRHGAVAASTAAEMASGVRERLAATWGVSTTGVAGPDVQEGKPIGTVYLAVSGPEGVATESLHLPATTRSAIRAASVTRALDLLRRRLAAGAAVSRESPRRGRS